MAKKSTTPSFVCELRILPDPGQAKKIRNRMKVARNFYNSAVREVNKRLKAMRESRAWRAACAMPKGEPKSKPRAARNAEFQRVRGIYGLGGERCLSDWVANTVGEKSSGNWIMEQLNSDICHALALRAANAACRVIFNGGWVHFKKKPILRSVSSRDSQQHPAIRWTGDGIEWSGGGRSKRAGKTAFARAVVNRDDPYIEHALSRRIKTCRIIREEVFGRERFYVQLVCEGHPYIPPDLKLGSGVVGIDIGPTIIAVASELEAFKTRLCDELESVHAEVKRHQQKASRRLQQANPDSFELSTKGGMRIKKGARLKIRTGGFRRARSDASEASRREKMARKILQSTLIRKIVTMGDVFVFEDLSCKSWQRNKHFAKSVQFRAPGMFIQLLKQVVAKLGGKVIEVPTRTTSLTASCHCGRKQKKKLSDRWHRCECQTEQENNRGIDRDIHSAYLARFAGDGTLDVAAAQKAWPGVSKLLIAASGAWNKAQAKRNPSLRAAGVGCRETRCDVEPCLTVLTPERSWASGKAGDAGKPIVLIGASGVVERRLKTAEKPNLSQNCTQATR